MPEHELEKLLGGFAADTLTPEEREKLFAAALQDQQLFNALADEQALKELLNDPTVRRRLLQALSPHRTVSPWRSWLDRFTTPAALAWTGGVAVGVFAVVLGLNVYEDSLRRASETAVPEEARPPDPSTIPPGTPSAEAPLNDAGKKAPKADPRPRPAAKDSTSSTTNRLEQAVKSRPREEPEQADKRMSHFKEGSKEVDTPVAALGKSSEQPAASSSPRPTRSSDAASGLDAQVPEPTGPGAATGASARALFWGHGSAPEIGVTAQEKEMETARKPEQFARRNTLGRTAPEKPLALRYAFVIREPDGQEREAIAAPALDHPGTVMLTMESNQDAYVQIWRRAGESLPELILPAKETARISLKTTTGQRQRLIVPRESDRLIVRLSRVPFGPITRQEAVMAGRGSTAQVTESPSGTEEHATYVANPNLSATELAVEILIGASTR
jgi:hypothetical protein